MKKFYLSKLFQPLKNQRVDYKTKDVGTHWHYYFGVKNKFLRLNHFIKFKVSDKIHNSRRDSEGESLRYHLSATRAN